MGKSIIRIKDVTKFYRMGAETIAAVNGLSLSIKQGEVCCLFGKSGSGKSTLLNLIAGLEKPTSGQIIFNKKHIERMNENPRLLFDMNGRLPGLRYSFPMALQHLVAMIVGCVTPAIIISTVAGFDNASRILLIQSSLVCAALSTLLQLFGITRMCGARLPVIMGVSFAYLATMQSIVGSFSIVKPSKRAAIPPRPSIAGPNTKLTSSSNPAARNPALM